MSDQISLLHYSRRPLVTVHSVTQDGRGAGCYKPRGLWVSVEGEDDWPHWCEGESFEAPFDCANEITLHHDHSILWLRSAYEIDAFTSLYGGGPRHEPINWRKVAGDHRGLIVAPYCWERRLADHTFWYYGWDCASGCIWNADAIAGITLRAQGTEARRAETSEAQAPSRSDDGPVAEGDAPQSSSPSPGDIQ